MMLSKHDVEAFRHYTPGARLFAAADAESFESPFLPSLDEGLHEIIRIRYASTTADCCSIRGSRRGGQVRLQLVDEYADELIAETVKIFDAVPTQGEVFDWLMSIRTRCDEEYIIPPIVPELTRAEADEFIRFASEAYPDLNLLYRTHLATIFPDSEQ